MNNEQAGTVYYDAIIETKSLKVTADEAEKILRGSTERSKRTTSTASREMSSSFRGVAQSLALVGSGYLSISGGTQFVRSAIADANRYQASLNGLASVSQAFTGEQEAALQAAREYAADGLIPLAQATTAFKNALSSGYSLEEAKLLLAGLKDQAVNNRQAYYDLGGAVIATTEGIKNGNSVLADATGTTKNLSVIAKEAGISVDEMGSIQQNTAYRTAILNSFLQEAARSTGDAARYADTAAGADARLATTMTNLRIEVGQVANALRLGAVSGLTELIATNQEAIISIGSGVTAMAAFAGGAFVARKAIDVFAAGLTMIARHPAVAILALTAGVLASLTISNLMDELNNAEKKSKGIDRNIAKMPSNLADSTKEAAKLAKQLAKIDADTAKANRDYREQLAELVASKEQSIAQLTEQVAQEKAAYEKAYSDRVSDFTKSQQEEAATHQQKVQALQAQIDFLSRYNNEANRKRLQELQFTLARENAEYNKQSQEQQAKFDQEAEYERLGYEKRVSELQTRLTNETNLLSKHRDDVASIRNVILLDEIDKLKRSRDEQLASLNQQRIDARDNAKGMMSDSLKTFEDNRKNFESLGTSLGNSMGNAMKDALKNAVIDTGKGIANFLGSATTFLFKGFDWRKSGQSINSIWKEAQNDPAFRFRANGGPVSSGQPYFVGENPDGSLNRTTELFVPNRSGTIVPSKDLQSFLQPNNAASIETNIHLSGTFATSATERRKVADQIVEAFNESLRAKGITELGRA